MVEKWQEDEACKLNDIVHVLEKEGGAGPGLWQCTKTNLVLGIQ